MHRSCDRWIICICVPSEKRRLAVSESVIKDQRNGFAVFWLNLRVDHEIYHTNFPSLTDILFWFLCFPSPLQTLSVPCTFGPMHHTTPFRTPVAGLRAIFIVAQLLFLAVRRFLWHFSYRRLFSELYYCRQFVVQIELFNWYIILFVFHLPTDYDLWYTQEYEQDEQFWKIKETIFYSFNCFGDYHNVLQGEYDSIYDTSLSFQSLWLSWS